jgi:hypothetical protein
MLDYDFICTFLLRRTAMRMATLHASEDKYSGSHEHMATGLSHASCQGRSCFPFVLWRVIDLPAVAQVGTSSSDVRSHTAPSIRWPTHGNSAITFVASLSNDRLELLYQST